MGTKHFAVIFLICCLYLLLRLGFWQTIEFGYDQPRLAYSVLGYLKSGDFINSQQFSVASPWGNFSWGPALVFFFAPFLTISKDPIVASSLVAAFNLLSVVIITYIGWKFFSAKVGIISGLFLAVQPWWVIFSRMVYQPTPIPTFIALSLLFLFMAIEKPKSLWLSLLIFSWAVLVQTYLITFSFIFTSFMILVVSLKGKHLPWKHFFIGIISSFILFLPSTYYYVNNREMFFKFFEAKGRFQILFSEVIKNFINVLSGGGINWQLGYAYKEFLIYLKVPEYVFFIFAGIILILICYAVVLSVKEKNFLIISLLFLLFAPIWAINFIGVEYVVPRYFLYVFPSLCLVLGYAVDKLVKKAGRVLFILPVIIASWWIFLILKYFTFIQNYTYPQGFLSHFSDVPYSFLDKSFTWVENDARIKGYSDFVISSDPNYPTELRLNWAQKYYWDNILSKTTVINGGRIGYYLMYFSPEAAGGPKNFVQFGPYIVYEYSSPEVKSVPSRIY